MTNTTTERTWTQAHSGDWLTDGANGRKYRWHPLSGLHCFDPGMRFEYGVATSPTFTSDPDVVDAAVTRNEAEAAAAGR